jgi:hypothetical protein
MWCVPAIDAEYIERMEDVLELYAEPLDRREPVVCLDEQPVVLHDAERPELPARLGQPTRRDCQLPVWSVHVSRRHADEHRSVRMSGVQCVVSRLANQLHAGAMHNAAVVLTVKAPIS